MECHQAEAIKRQFLLKVSEELFSLRQKLHERVDHDVADKENLLCGDALALEILISVWRWCEEQVGELIGNKPVDLLRHLAIEGPQSRLHMSDADSKLCADQRGGNRRIDVPIDKHNIRLAREDHRLELGHDRSRLLRVRTGTDIQALVGRGNLKRLKEDVGHQSVIVLSCVHQNLIE